jgi:hypothetical protein
MAKKLVNFFTTFYGNYLCYYRFNFFSYTKSLHLRTDIQKILKNIPFPKNEIRSDIRKFCENSEFHENRPIALQSYLITERASKKLSNMGFMKIDACYFACFKFLHLIYQNLIKKVKYFFLNWHLSCIHLVKPVSCFNFNSHGTHILIDAKKSNFERKNKKDPKKLCEYIKTARWMWIYLPESIKCNYIKLRIENFTSAILVLVCIALPFIIIYFACKNFELLSYALA